MGGGKCQARVPSPQSLPVGGLHPWSLGSLGPGPQWAFSRSPGHRLLRGWPHSPYPAGPPASLACLSPDQPWRLGRGLRGFARRPRDCALLKRQYRLPEQGFSVLGSAGALCEGGHSLCPRPDGFPRPLHNREVERSLRGSPREEPWSDLLGQLRVGWGGPWVHPSPTFHGLKDNDKISFEKKESL